MTYTPVELRHVRVGRSLFGYNRATVEQVIEEVAESFEATWRERGELADKVETLEKQLDGAARARAAADPDARRGRAGRERRARAGAARGRGDRHRGPQRGARDRPVGSAEREALLVEVAPDRGDAPGGARRDPGRRRPDAGRRAEPRRLRSRCRRCSTASPSRQRRDRMGPRGHRASSSRSQSSRSQRADAVEPIAPAPSRTRRAVEPSRSRRTSRRRPSDEHEHEHEPEQARARRSRSCRAFPAASPATSTGANSGT